MDWLSAIRELEENGVRLIAVTQSWTPISRTRHLDSCSTWWAPPAEFKRPLIRERTQPGRLRYQQYYDAGRVDNGVYGRSGRNRLRTGPTGSLTRSR
jgi:hypothetical protein